MTELTDKLIVLVGRDGFFGTHIAQELLRRGARVRVASRHPEQAFRIKPLGNLGQTQTVPVNITRPGTLPRAVAGADAVINLVGAFGGDLQALHVTGAGELAAAAAAAGVPHFIHVSALGASAESESLYARTKIEGEAAVRAAFPAATILRPAVLFGPDDDFLNLFARFDSVLPVVPVFAPDAQLQPLFVDDAAEAVVAVLTDTVAHSGKTFELAGPETVTMLELNRRIASASYRDPLFLSLPDGIAAAIAWLPGTPITRDQWVLLKKNNLASGNLPGLAELGITARPLGLFLDRWMERYRKHGRFGVRANPLRR